MLNPPANSPACLPKARAHGPGLLASLPTFHSAACFHDYYSTWRSDHICRFEDIVTRWRLRGSQSSQGSRLGPACVGRYPTATNLFGALVCHTRSCHELVMVVSDSAFLSGYHRDGRVKSRAQSAYRQPTCFRLTVRALFRRLSCSSKSSFALIMITAPTESGHLYSDQHDPPP